MKVESFFIVFLISVYADISAQNITTNPKSGDKDIHQTVTIGDQTWIVKNLDVTCYQNGDPIPQVQNAKEWSKLTTGAWCYYLNDDAFGPVFGKLYNWYAVNDPRGLAPEGWHIPSDGEWVMLSDFLGGAKVAGGKLKDIETMIWRRTSRGATNESGFSAIPTGVRRTNGDFSRLLTLATFWSSSQRTGLKKTSWGREIGVSNNKLERKEYYRSEGHAVRLICSVDSCSYYPDLEIGHRSANSASTKDVVKIGKQRWMSKTLDVVCYSNGDTIPQVQSVKKWKDITTGAWCYSVSSSKSGYQINKLYNGFALCDSRGIAPEGFRIANLEDLNNLIYFIIDNRINDKRLSSDKENLVYNLFTNTSPSRNNAEKAYTSKSTYWAFSEKSPEGVVAYSPRFGSKKNARIDSDFQTPKYPALCVKIPDDSLTVALGNDAPYMYFGLALGVGINFLNIRPVGDLDKCIFNFAEVPNNFPVPVSARILSISSSIDPGMVIGLSGNLRLSKYFDLKVTPSVFFSKGEISYKMELYYLHDDYLRIDTAEMIITKTIPNTFFNFPLEMKFTFIRSRLFQPYIIAGIQYSLALASNTRNKSQSPDNYKLKFNQNNLYATAGVGLSFYSRLMKFSLELKDMFGFLDILKKEGNIYTDCIQSVKSNIVQFTFQIE